MKQNENRLCREEGGFTYIYSAKDRAEIQRIRDKYTAEMRPRGADRLAELRRLDASVTKGAMALSLCVGLLGTLLMGSGMSLIMTDLGALWAMSPATALAVGTLVGLVGMVGVLLAYPLYHATVERKRKKLAPEILRLAEALLDEGM